MVYGVINDGSIPLKITKACQTRWMSIEIAIKRISEQWLELKTHFGIASISENCFTAKTLYKLFKDESLYLLSIFLKNLLKETQLLNKALQSQNADPT